MNENQEKQDNGFYREQVFGMFNARFDKIEKDSNDAHNKLFKKQEGLEKKIDAMIQQKKYERGFMAGVGGAAGLLGTLAGFLISNFKSRWGL